jgi:hypothetical protein
VIDVMDPGNTKMPQSDFLPSYRSYRGNEDGRKPLTLQQAAGIAGVSPDTVARWCKRYGIGKQLHRKAPWRVDSVGLAIVAAGDAEALAEYRDNRPFALSGIMGDP